METKRKSLTKPKASLGTALRANLKKRKAQARAINSMKKTRKQTTSIQI